ncbi:tRNA (guanine-N7-)-methyltransferase [Saccharopolyspora lacisalsi]|uniref:tRNA (guanine-N(7)-)-methyltransferase n=1 Tax=Halosaccharopolyspora lacisalsi TaxID=1000566 RepID=A0A839E7S2_9PSEU|nr:tRNA (guanosine(46)-N7)-methyltransferase TrmB [Halosaccharopolyspora lacisalsi]MBA8827321.1 tRNA (guanine-N7-)-methyltransferase [Halosaccharopolyspora lacisalsi]
MSASDQQVPFHRTVVSYVRRSERTTTGQQRAWDRYWPELGAEIDALPEGTLDVSGWFGRSAPVILEIGSGMGEATAELATARPDANHLAVEVYKPGLAQLLLRIEKLGLDNLRLLRGDAVMLLRNHIEPNSLSEIRVFFPDPWPKKRHHKRRLVQDDIVEMMASRLAVGGFLHLATDWEQYAEQMLEMCHEQPTLRNHHADMPGGWAPRPEWRPVTKFEQRAEEEGRVIRDLVFERI